MSFSTRLRIEDRRLQCDVLSRRYRPDPLRRYRLRVGDKVRNIGEPTARDCRVLDAWRAVADPELEARLLPHVWGYRVGRDRFGAVETLGVALPERYTLVRCDVADMFDSLDHGVLASAVAWAWPAAPSRGASLPWQGALPWRCAVPWEAPMPWSAPTRHTGADALCAWLIETWLRAWQRGVGVPTGTSMSPALSNAYFGATVDGWIESELRRGRLCAAVRYADDFALVARGDGREALTGIEGALAAARLRLNPSKTRLHGVEGPWPATILGVEVAPRAGRLVALQ